MTLKDFKGMTWMEIKRAMPSMLILLGLSDCRVARDCARAVRDYGTEAGAAIVCAFLFMDKHGAPRTMREGAELYKGLVPKLEKKGWKVSQLRSDVDNMLYWMAWMSATYSPAGKTLEWPIRFPCRKPDKVAGLANIMLLLGAMNTEGEENTTILASGAVMRFLKEGMERKREMAA